jgi:hypothetical protein
MAYDHTRTQDVVTGSLLFIEPGREKPYVTYPNIAGAVSETNAVYRAREVAIRNARADAPSLDVEGFAFVRGPFAASNFASDLAAEALGRLEAARIVQRATGAAQVVVFDHTLRSRTPDSARGPSTRVHNDYTPTSALRRADEIIGSERERFTHMAFVNLWRPLAWPAEDWPLALCDARSAAPEDYVATDILYPDRRGEIFALKHNPRQRWSYFPALALDEAILIKCFDTRAGIARYAPHTAFADPNTPADAPPRRSVEFRCIALFA